MGKPKIGLALGSGGARGLLHIGVLNVLLEEGISIDMIAGASSGSIIGGYYCLKGEIRSFEEVMFKFGKRDLFRMIDINSPKRGLISGKKVMSFFHTFFGESTFSDLKIPLVIIATDMNTGEEVHFSDGRILDAIRASISLPGIFPPAELNNSLYLDGGIVNPTPADVLREQGADVIIAVDLTMSSYTKIDKPTMVDTLTRSFEIMRTNMTKKMLKEDDRTVILRSREKSMGDTYKFYDMRFIKEGERICRDAIPRIKEIIRKAES